MCRHPAPRYGNAGVTRSQCRVPVPVPAEAVWLRHVRGTALVPTDTSYVSRSSRSADASDDLDAHRHIDALNLSAGGRTVNKTNIRSTKPKLTGSNPVWRVSPEAHN